MLYIIFEHKYNIVMLRIILDYAFLYIIYLFTYTVLFKVSENKV